MDGQFFRFEHICLLKKIMNAFFLREEKSKFVVEASTLSK